ncbi:IclR family transcriptional regulator [Phaeobacter gallaeciensis]|uniref:IclR family transcriptional regulator n=1 Tax=Phaeobacter gallaeciensis TaxID=60890 RepID=UPI00237F57EC|nr:IclR family transcriptional regulator [Phaeobacter gallaeciensis]MDE4305727.1 IclR family transcriptional regulator [Phaeobacter gallaeciensis]MDE4310075.1 IclR family transcriptional regulator [Phaeobacter gallaeciensis]MDE4314526.1 IclR family transcriptional regulator [Phaeobacter gallaeciensis]MDE4318998.1 IclR family transcriptional regulator [Phaeobacter gallaeciensis]MDE4323461.1 IclR family transcriptional regulator [Phaeobacter gallaeciensis]
MAAKSAETTTKRQVPAVTRAIAILRFLARSDEPVGVNPIARELELVPSTCLHILRVLQDEGLVDFDSNTKRYSIGIGILPLARSALQKNTFSVLVQPLLSGLSEKFGVTSIATQVAEPSQMVVIALSQSTLPFRLQVDLGSRFPILISATGRLFAAFNVTDPEELRSGFDKLVWDHPPSFEDWRTEVEATRARGYAVDRGTYISGVTVVAAPVFNAAGQMIRSLVAIGISERMDDKQVASLAKSLLKLRDKIEAMQIETRS